MPILPLIDALILLAWTIAIGGGVMKLVNMLFGVHWDLIGFGPADMLTIAMALLMFSLALIGRSWVKANDPEVRAAQRANSTLEAYTKMKGEDNGKQAPTGGPVGVSTS